MSIIIILSSIVIPLMMAYVQGRWVHFQYAFHVASIVAALIFGNIAAVSVYQIIRDHVVFMTTIHAVLLNPFFLVSGAYLGMFLIYQLLLLTMKANGESGYRSP
ncbi:transposase [Cohnella sp. WQ 127256]|uniref:transposase n=1 Tax=Cohnella sp. WQ 127256 TaxID=2938790 RepID=UPI002118DAC1|nr:transposase [Cohnella sp. WQ 127256]